MRIIFFFATFSLISNVFSQNLDTTHYRLKNVVYKTTPEAELSMDIYYPKKTSADQLPAVVFFFGGGWVGGSRAHFAPQSKYLASRGIIAITPDYRIKNKHNTLPQDAVMDARSVMRYLKLHAQALGIDTSMLAAGGGSAGGHLALSTAALSGFDDTKDDLSMSPMPDALLLFNPVVNTTSSGFGAKAVGRDTFNLSPYHRMMQNLPPTLIFHGTSDTTVPFCNIVELKAKMDALLISNQVFAYDNAVHGFFNLGKEDGKYFLDTLYKADLFLQSQGYLNGPALFTPPAQ